jgi:hypothetical protein
MVMIELRDSAYDTAFELLDEAMHNAKKTKLTLCELEDAMYECYEASKEDEYDAEPEAEFRHSYRDEDEDDMNMRYRNAMRRRSTSRAGLRMRRNRMGRYV